MLRLKPTYEEMLREAKTRRLKILPERERRTQQGMLLDDLDMDDFDLDKYDKKTILMNENPEKGTQTDRFNKTFTTESESAKTVIEDQRVKEEEQAKSAYSRQTSEASEEKERQKSLTRRLFDSLFQEVEADLPRSRQTSQNVAQEEVMTLCQIKRVKHPCNQVHDHHQQQVEVFCYQLKVLLLVSMVQEAKL